MKKVSVDEVTGMGLNEIIAAILGEEDVSGVTMIMPGQPIVHIEKLEREVEESEQI